MRRDSRNWTYKMIFVQIMCLKMRNVLHHQQINKKKNDNKGNIVLLSCTKSRVSIFFFTEWSKIWKLDQKNAGNPKIYISFFLLVNILCPYRCFRNELLCSTPHLNENVSECRINTLQTHTVIPQDYRCAFTCVSTAANIHLNSPKKLHQTPFNNPPSQRWWRKTFPYFRTEN